MCTSSNINPLSTVAVAETGFRQHIPALKPKDIRFISALAFVTLKTTGTEAAMIRERSDVWGCFLFPVNIYLRWRLDSQVLSLFTWTDFTGLPDTFLSAVKSGEVSVHADIHLQTPGQKHRAVLNNGTKSTTTLLICYVYGKHLSIQSSKGSFLGITNACKMMEKKENFLFNTLQLYKVLWQAWANWAIPSQTRGGRVCALRLFNPARGIIILYYH